MQVPVIPPVRAAFRAIAETVVPELARASEADWRAVEREVEAQLATRPPALRRQLALFVRVLDLLPVLRWGRRLQRMDVRRRARVLARLERAPVLLLRRGFWSLRTLVFLGWYTRPDVASRLGYRPHARGWLARRPAAARQPVAIPGVIPLVPPATPPPHPLAPAAEAPAPPIPPPA